MPHRETHSSVPPSPPVRDRTLWSPREAYLLALVCLLSGLVMGYLFHGSSPAAVLMAGNSGNAAPAMPGTAPAGSAGMPSVQDLGPLSAPLLAALKVDPKNAGTLIQLGNLYYDHQLYSESIQYYTRALEVDPKNINVRTDLGTAYWYSGFPEKAVAEYEKSLALDPSHVNTVFNMGVVRLEGLKDPKGAEKYLEKVLALNATPQQRERAQEMLAKVRSKSS